MDGIIVYLLIGTLWCFITDVFMTEMENNNTRLRYIVFWPVTFIAFVMGLLMLGIIETMRKCNVCKRRNLISSLRIKIKKLVELVKELG